MDTFRSNISPKSSNLEKTFLETKNTLLEMQGNVQIIL